NQVVHTTVGMFGRTRKDIRIVEKLRDDIWPVMGDQGQIEQVLLNLCINAWQAMPDGGNIYFETKNIELDASLVQPLDIPVGRYVCISVADMGIGMDEATQNRIFEPFFTTKEIGRGTGLGLASAYGIIKNHDGAIDFVSRVGEGTTFYIYLPVSESPVCETKVTTTAPTKGAGTILLVDDEKMVLDVNKSMLEQLGYKVLSALGGRPAIEIFDHTKELIDLVILDMVMPDMNGAAVFDHFISQRPDIKVLLSSGHSLSEQTEALIKRGCKGFIQKPYKLEELGARIQELLRTGS
ncbi:MAG: response regulator, partial [Desulfatitalea sp.]|nr:response regulator [Desulfatitalea sp.]NNK02373.1 response regulator [Desulfatitalea sp.]